MSLTSYRAAPPRVCLGCVGRPGGDLLSRALRRSTMGAGGFHVRVRDGIGCSLPAKATRSSNTALGVAFVLRVAFGVRFWCCVHAVVNWLALFSISPRRGIGIDVAVLVWMIAVHGLTRAFGLSALAVRHWVTLSLSGD